MKMQKRTPSTAILVMALAFLCSSLSAQQLTIRDGRNESSIQARVLEGVNYYRIDDLSEALGFRYTDAGANLEVIGERGSLTCISGRPLVRSGSQYILLSSPIAKLRSSGWWVPPDFLEKALPNILSRRLIPEGPGVYRIEALNQNSIRVDTVDYPDHVSVVFRTSKEVNPRIRDFRNFVEIRFDQYVVSLEDIRNPSTFDVVSSITFDPNDGLGTFRVNKGSNYGRYREYVLSNPPRVVIDFFEEEREASSPSTRVPEPGTEVPAPVQGDQADEDSYLPASGVLREEVVLIDPGHGGLDPGFEMGSRVMEKQLTLAVARLVMEELEAQGIKTRMTRDRDVYLTPEQRSSSANFYSTRAFVSLHLGASPSRATQGPVVYLHKPFQEPVAEGEAGTDNSSPQPAPQPSSSGDDTFLVPWDRGQDNWISRSRLLAAGLQDSLNQVFLAQNEVMEIPLSLLEPVRAPAVVVEFGFLTNPLDREFLMTEGYREEIASLIAEGVMDFLR